MRKSMGEGSEQEARRYYDDFSVSYERGRAYGYHQMIDDLEVQVTTPYARGARVLELGCGTGLILARIAKIAEEAVGIDLSEGMAQRARDRGLDVRIGSVCDLPFELIDYHGVRMLTPFAAVHRIPWVGRGLCRAELLAGHSPLRYLGGFLIAVLRKA
jgi:SAM-dependent methyltransferase